MNINTAVQRCVNILGIVTLTVTMLGVASVSGAGLVVVRQEASGAGRMKREVGPMSPEHQNNVHRKYRRLEHSIMVQADIRSRYASTLVTSMVENSEPHAREVFFNVILPETAFISRFAMEVDGIYYLAQVKQKEKAWKMYKDAVENNQTAGHVDVEARHSNRFKVSVNTEAKTVVQFYLVYEELLGRHVGRYHYTVNINPHLRLSSYGMGVTISEMSDITHIDVKRLSLSASSKDSSKEKHDDNDADSELPGVDIKLSPTNPGKATVTYMPNIQELERDLKHEKHPLQLIVEYEVERNNAAGEVQLLDGYFVHFTAPDNLVPMPKHVVFVLDTSGSMKHRKMRQTISAMVTILGEMRDQDYLTIVSFATNVTVWEDMTSNIVQSTPSNIAKAIKYVESLEAAGETNINDALLQAFEILSSVKQREIMKDVQPMVFFLTDGHPTVGVTDTLQILGNIRKANTEHIRAPLFSLAFGRRTDFQMLRLLSVQNYGFARKIYTAADASLQMEGFYKEVSSPILTNVTFDYLDSNIIPDSLTETAFHTFYQGGEMVIAGRMDDDAVMPVFEYEITAHHTQGEFKQSGDQLQTIETVDTYIEMLPSFNMSDYNYMERLWAYLSVRSLLAKVERGELYSCQPGDYPASHQNAADYGEDQSHVEPMICNNLERALLLSLKYQFVTPLTSLVVVKPDIIEDGDIREADMFNRKIKVVSGSNSFMIVTKHTSLLILSMTIFVTFLLR